nr:pyrroline-5-carboxylate reductase [Campylobacterota bacterium]
MNLTIIGAGKMAEAIVEGTYKNFNVEVVARDSEVLEKFSQKYHVMTTVLKGDYNIEGKNILLCVKPYALDAVSKRLIGSANALLSVLAGTSLAMLRGAITSQHYVRIMPNLAAAHGKSMSTLCGDEAYRDQAILVCNTFGKALWLGSEKEIDIATAVAGSGPAFLALVAEALSDGAVKSGLKRDDANSLVQGLFEGFPPLLSEMHPALLKDAVMSPGGTTAAGYGALEEGSVRDSF